MGAIIAALFNTKRTKDSQKSWKPSDFFPPIKPHAELAAEVREMEDAARPETRREKALAMRAAIAAAFGIHDNGADNASRSSG